MNDTVTHILMRALLLVFSFSMTPTAYAFVYTPENIHYAYHEAPSTFEVASDGTAVGATVSGIPFRQRNITNSMGIRLQRFEIGLAYWYVSDRGVIWAQSDLAALSVYLSRSA